MTIEAHVLLEKNLIEGTGGIKRESYEIPLKAVEIRYNKMYFHFQDTGQGITVFCDIGRREFLDIAEQGYKLFNGKGRD